MNISIESNTPELQHNSAHSHSFGLSPIAENIPTGIQKGCWCVWKAKPRANRPGKFDKIPFAYSRRISTRDPAQWMTFADAVGECRQGGYNGIGKLILPSESLIFVDIDGDADAAKWQTQFPTYCELSPSGTGLRLIGRGAISRDVTKPIEIYAGHAPRFVTITGNRCGESFGIEAIESQAQDFINQNASSAPLPVARSDRPDLIDAATDIDRSRIPSSVEKVLTDGFELGADRSTVLMGVENQLVRAGYSGAEILTLLASSEPVLDVALEHRQLDYEKALNYLWFDIQKAQGYAKPLVAATEVFAGIPLYGSTDQIPCESFPDKKTNKKGEVTGLKATNENLKFLLSSYGIRTSYDAHTKEANFAIPGLVDTVYGKNDVAIGEIISKAVRCGLSKQDLQKMILDLSYTNPDFPIRDYLSSLKWDGVDHISKLCETLHVPEESEQARNISVLLWLIQCAAAADGAEQTPNKSALARFEHVLLLGGRQGLNKTKWFRALVPAQLQSYFKDGLAIDPNDRDSVKKATRFWLAEIGEIDATFRHADLARLKAFLSETDDVYRVSYGRTENRYPRMTSFCGSVNEMRFLKDATGSRRYWPITPHKITLPQDAGISTTQVWAQAWHRYMSGGQWWPSDTQEAVIQATRTAVEQDHETAIGETLFDYFGDCSPERKQLPGSRQMKLLEIARAIGISKPNKREYTDIRTWLERNNLDLYGRPDSATHAHQNRWLMPPRCVTTQYLVYPTTSPIQLVASPTPLRVMPDFLK